MGFRKLGGPKNEDCSIFWSILGVLIFRETTIRETLTVARMTPHLGAGVLAVQSTPAMDVICEARSIELSFPGGQLFWGWMGSDFRGVKRVYDI